MSKVDVNRALSNSLGIFWVLAGGLMSYQNQFVQC